MYYGDEIGMREVLDLDPVEGSMYRTGARTPMQWSSAENAGFSQADEDELYIPLDSDKNRPTVEQQLADSDSILNFVKSILAFRKANPALKASAGTEFLFAQEDTYPLVYRRFCAEQSLIVAVNPADRAVSADISRELRLKPVFVFGGGAQVNASKIEMQPQSFAIFEEIR
jgi:maltose alpha-D-glucosyltransferase/alpha-amylase